MNIKLRKVIKFIIIAFICMSLFASSIVSRDEHHLEICHDEDCFRCNIIKIAQSIISLSIALMVCIIIGFLTYYFLSRLNKVEKGFVLFSLVSQKVQLSE